MKLTKALREQVAATEERWMSKPQRKAVAPAGRRMSRREINELRMEVLAAGIAMRACSEACAMAVERFAAIAKRLQGQRGK